MSESERNVWTSFVLDIKKLSGNHKTESSEQHAHEGHQVVERYKKSWHRSNALRHYAKHYSRNMPYSVILPKRKDWDRGRAKLLNADIN